GGRARAPRPRGGVSSSRAAGGGRPAILALARIRMGDVERPRDADVGAATSSVRKVLSDRRLLVFAGCILLFQLANAAMLPLMGGILTLRSSQWASTLIGACIVVPQLVVAG